MSKTQLRVSAITVGAIASAAVHYWPEHAAASQMVFYTVMVIGLVLSGVWAYNESPRFWQGTAVVFLLHGIVLVSMRSLFPFRTILIIIPFVLIECIVAFILMLNVLEI